MARKADQLAREREHPRDQRVAGVEARVLDPRVLGFVPVPPLHRLRESLHLGRVQAERLADVAYRALRPVADHRRRERRTVAAVLRVEVLDYLLAALVLEVDVDVRRLVALPRDEALEQHGHARRVHLGDAERVAGRRVRRRAAALAQDVAAARELDQVVHGQEVALVAELCDQRELALDEGLHRRRRAIRPAPHGARLHQTAQVRFRRRARGHDFLRVLVAQLVEREAAALRDLPRRVEERARVQRLEPRDRPQGSLAVREERTPRARDRGPQAHRGQHVLQGAAPALVHVHVAARDRRQPEPLREGRKAPEPLAVSARGDELDRDPEAALEALAEPLALLGHGLGGRQPQGKAAGKPRIEVRTCEPVLPLGRRPAPARDQARERPVPLAGFSEHDQRGAVREPQLAAHHEWQARLARGDMGPHDARERALVGQRERGIPELLCALDKLSRVRRPTQEREIADAMQFRVRHR